MMKPIARLRMAAHSLRASGRTARQLLSTRITDSNSAK